MYSGKSLLITGGTGSFGNAVMRKFINTDIDEIRIFSRDEKKQDDMRQKFNSNKLKFYLGDVRDYKSLLYASEGVDLIFHAAALKQVPSCEFFPLEAVKTNIIGTENVINSAFSCNVKHLICLSTDKAVYPINAMGISKAMMEKLAISKSRLSNSTNISITRYGNVMGSRGSVIPLFIEQIRSGIPLTITNPEMTRFMLSLDDAVDLVLKAFNNAKSGDIYIKKSDSCTILTLAKSLLELMGKKDHPINIIGTRHGEKLYEVLIGKEEKIHSRDIGDYYCISPDLRDLNYSKFINKGVSIEVNSEEYNSHNTNILNISQMKEKLKSVKSVNKYFN